jgi:hypothetical protein
LHALTAGVNLHAASAPAAAGLALERGIRVFGAFARDPLEAYERARDQIAERREQQDEPPSYAPDERWSETLRELIGARAGEADPDAEFVRGLARCRAGVRGAAAAVRTRDVRRLGRR